MPGVVFQDVSVESVDRGFDPNRTIHSCDVGFGNARPKNNENIICVTLGVTLSIT